MATIHVDIVSAEGEIHSGEAKMVFAPARMGEVGIAPRHAPLLTALTYGELRVKRGDEEDSFAIGGGFIEVQPDQVTVLAERNVDPLVKLGDLITEKVRVGLAGKIHIFPLPPVHENLHPVDFLEGGSGFCG